MKKWAIATGVLALGGAVAASLSLGFGARASAGVLSNQLVLAERTPSASKAAGSVSVASPQAAPPAPSMTASAPAPVSPEALARIVSFRQTSTYNGAPVYVPEGCHGAYDLILHFHGAHPYVRELVEKANIDAVVAVFNAGNGAEKYAQAFGAGGTLSSLLRQVEMATGPLCAGAKPRRVALTAWSAGYGAAERLLSRAEDRERVDAVLLADGLHAGFTDPWKRSFAPNALQPFRDFGALALGPDGKKLLAITHSSIITDGYGSTTECSRLLLDALNVPCADDLVSGKSGNFSIEGSTGQDKAAHIAQFRQMDTTLLSKLRARWSDTAP